jgi:hypothetical protein
MEGRSLGLFKVIYRHLPSGTEENQEYIQSGNQVNRPRFETAISSSLGGKFLVLMFLGTDVHKTLSVFKKK